MPISGNGKKNNYYEQQKRMCKALGIKTPPKETSLWQKFKYIYQKLTKG